MVLVVISPLYFLIFFFGSSLFYSWWSWSILFTHTKNQLLVLLIFSYFLNLYFIYFLCDLYYFLPSVDFRFVRELIKGKKCLFSTYILYGLPAGSVVKNLLTSKGVVGLIPELGRSPGEGNGNPLQYSCLENPRGRGARQATVHGDGRESEVTYQLNNNDVLYIA